ncbi:hypothetical protein [Candidatus Reidiella endopervernicosa]|uniref:ATP-binding protein n=1 Tax=Candidatus Reidiella endopervernicosa TaxID=2738883 RepID=A0A6N0HSJ2_9GAMM|nr:hypothetical protein [Candidatus Reidiella endopervernicosa]QKQ25231.1 hypothetical protein HUE57_02175 [Candidatus Reidiella endopervernicosa]
MTTEILMHIDEDLSDQQQKDLLASFGNRTGGLQPHLHSEKAHLMFVAYDPEELCPHDLIAIAAESGVHASLIEL